MYPNNVKETGLQEVDNLYLRIINDCRHSIDAIRTKANIIISPQMSKVADILTRTELESALTNLLVKIRELEDEIVV